MAIKKIKITYIGEPKTVKTKKGSFQSIGMRIDGFDGWLNARVDNESAKWEKGQEITVNVTTNTKNNITYYNVTPLSDEQKQIIDLANRVTALELEVSNIKAKFGLSNGSESVKESKEVKENLPV